MTQERSGPQSGSARGSSREAIGPLSVTRAPVKERADAARNRLRVLDAAESLFLRHGVAGVTMDDIAKEAGVGKGTLYRRFPDKGELAVALLSERGRELQESMMSGAPPLGPGAPAGDRLVAFATTYLRFQVAHLDLVLLSETSTPGSRLTKGSYSFWRQHCTMLLKDAGVRDATTRAEILLAGLSAEQVRHWQAVEGRSIDGLSRAVGRTARALAEPG